MMSESLKESGIDGLLQAFDAVTEDMQGGLETVLQALGKEMKAEMDKNIGGHPTLQNAQEIRVKIFSNGGYTAIRPKTGGYRIAGKKYKGNNIKAWDLTHFTNDGHMIRKPSGKSKRYRARIHTPYVTGKGYYERTRSWAESTAVREINDFADQIADKLEG